MNTQRIVSGSPYERTIGFSRAVRIGAHVLVSGTAPVPPPGEAVAGTPYDQMMRCGEIIRVALAEAGCDLGAVVRTRMYIVDARDADEIGRAHRALFGAAMPAATMVVVAGLLDPSWRVEVEVDAMIA